MAGWFFLTENHGSFPSINGCYLGGSPIFGNLHCPFLEGMLQSYHATFPRSPTCPWHVFSQLSDGGVVTFQSPALKIGVPSCGHQVMGKVLESLGKRWKAMESLGTCWGIHGYAVDQTRAAWDFLCAHLTSVHALKKPGKRGRNAEGRGLSCQLGEQCYSQHMQHGTHITETGKLPVFQSIANPQAMIHANLPCIEAQKDCSRDSRAKEHL